MDQEFAEKILLITGATSGIGKATALRFGASGASIAAVGRDETALIELKERIGENGGTCLTIHADLSLEGEIGMVVSRTVEHFGGVATRCRKARRSSSRCF